MIENFDPNENQENDENEDNQDTAAEVTDVVLDVVGDILDGIFSD